MSNQWVWIHLRLRDSSVDTNNFSFMRQYAVACGTSPFLFPAPEVPELEKHRCNTRLPANRRYSPVSKTISCSELRGQGIRPAAEECQRWGLQSWPAPAVNWLTNNNRLLCIIYLRYKVYYNFIILLCATSKKRNKIMLLRRNAY